MQFKATIIITLAAMLAVLTVILAISILAALFGGSFKGCFRAGSAFLLLPAVLMLFGHFFGCNVFPVKNYDVVSGNIPEAFDNYRIVHISDLHLASFRHRKAALRRAVKKINRQNPDLIVFTGDLITFTSSEIDAFTGILSELEARDGIYSVMGNHDYCHYNFEADHESKKADRRRLREMEKAIGWTLLENDCSRIERDGGSIILMGGENGENELQSERHLETVLKKCPDGGFRILLFHNPSVWRSEIAGSRKVDLTLSGHTHAMQFSVFGWSPSLFLFEEYRGMYEHDGQLLCVNAGLGETGVMARIGAWPEIGVLTLRPAGRVRAGRTD